MPNGERSAFNFILSSYLYCSKLQQMANEGTFFRTNESNQMVTFYSYAVQYKPSVFMLHISTTRSFKVIKNNTISKGRCKMSALFRTCSLSTTGTTSCTFKWSFVLLPSFGHVPMKWDFSLTSVPRINLSFLLTHLKSRIQVSPQPLSLQSPLKTLPTT